MFNRIFGLVGWFRTPPSLVLFAVLLLVAHSLPTQANPVNAPVVVNPSAVSSFQPLKAVPEELAPDMTQVPEEIAQDMTQTGVQLDPLDSPHPIPWSWVLATHAEMSANNSSGVRYYRSQSLLSPDGKYAAYSRLQMEGQPELYKSRITSVMFVENLETGDLRTITASSPLADNPLLSTQEADIAGTIAILIPVSWSKSSARILARQFEGILSTSDASDYAVIWDRQQNRTTTLVPKAVPYDYAVLLGWSQTNPDRVLFRAGEMGNEQWPVWSVDLNGQTALALEDEPSVYGQVVNQVWAGPQARW